jgi:myotubularin-related protein 5/13
MVNRDYALCSSYPSTFIVPSAVNDDQLRKVAKAHKLGRLPIVTWCSGRGALLLRASGFHFKNMGNRLAKATTRALQKGQELFDGTTQERVQTAQKTSIEHERFLHILASMSPSSSRGVDGVTTRGDDEEDDFMSVDSIVFARDTDSSTGRTGTTEATGGDAFSSGRRLPNLPATLNMKTWRSSHTKIPPLNTLSVAKTTMKSTAATTTKFQQQPQSLQRASLYIFGDQQHAKSLKLPTNTEFVPITYPTASNVKQALTKLLRVTAPSTLHAQTVWQHGDVGTAAGGGGGAASTDSAADAGHLRALDDSRWLQIVACLLRLAGAGADLLECGSSLAVCIEDGWDACAQLTALIQLLADAHYRTLTGFHTLVDKEWLRTGHRFSHRHNHFRSTATNGIAPMFLLFLDAVHQIHRQYPGAFEFNDFYLRYLAYHSMSGYTSDFLLDCEADRVQANTAATTPERPSLWSMIEIEQSTRRRIFTNDQYAPGLYTGCGTLRPVVNIAAIDLWSYYTEDPLATGATYDLSAMDGESSEREQCATDVNTIGRQHVRTYNQRDYNSCMYSLSSGVRALLDEIDRLEKDLCIAQPHVDDGCGIVQRAREHAMQIVSDDDVASENEGVDESALNYERWMKRNMQKRFVVDLLLRGNRAQQAISNTVAIGVADGTLRRDSTLVTKNQTPPIGRYQHVLVRHHFNTPETCRLCNKVLYGVVVHYGLKCAKCDYAVHQACTVEKDVPHTCAVADVVENVQPILRRSSTDGGGKLIMI